MRKVAKMAEVSKVIEEGKAVLGIEFGSTRIKAVLVDDNNQPIAQGSHDWENRLENGVWTYRLDDIWTGLQDCYAKLKEDVWKQYGVKLTKLAALGFSAMMHGYMVFNEKDELMVPFRTWRNTMTGEASEELTKAFDFHIPQRWSVAHLYQSVLNKEEHVKDIKFLSTLAVYIHWQMTGKKVAGVGEASGMFPIDMNTKNYDSRMVEIIDRKLQEKGVDLKVEEILPTVLSAGEDAGTLTEKGAKLLDVSGELQAGCPVCPCEGDAGTGMVATNAVKVRTGNVSAGTSVFGMIVLEKDLSKAYDEIDLVTTPEGYPVAMAHCNNCTSDLNAWIQIFKEYNELFGIEIDINDLYGKLYRKALEGDDDCGGLLAYNYFSGEHITNLNEGRPLFVRTADSKFTLANFMRTHLFTSISVLKTGLDILIKEENVKVDSITGHGGLFKTKGVGQNMLAAALNAPVTCMETAGEGGAWGIALLASYMIHKKEGETLDQFLAEKVFADAKGETVSPDAAMVAGFDAYLERYTKGLAIEKAAVESI